MFRTFCIYFSSFTAFFPGATASGYGLLAAAEKAKFDTQFPSAHEKLATFLNTLMYVFAEHTFPYLCFTALAALIWTLIIAEPKALAKRKHKDRLLKVRS